MKIIAYLFGRCKYMLYIYNIIITQKDTTMKNETLKNKVEAKLVKWGNNANDVKEMIALHFEQASKNYSTVNAIAEYIRTVY